METSGTVIETAACYLGGHRDVTITSRGSQRWCDEILSRSRRSSRCSDKILSPPEYLMYARSHARAVFGLILGEIPDSSWEGIWNRVIYVSLRDTFHVFVICGNPVTIAVIPVCRIANREVDLSPGTLRDHVCARA